MAYQNTEIPPRNYRGGNRTPRKKTPFSKQTSGGVRQNRYYRISRGGIRL